MATSLALKKTLAVKPTGMDNVHGDSSSDFSSSIYRHLYNPLESSVWHELATSPQRKLSSANSLPDLKGIIAAMEEEYTQTSEHQIKSRRRRVSLDLSILPSVNESFLKNQSTPVLEHALRPKSIRLDGLDKLEGKPLAYPVRRVNSGDEKNLHVYEGNVLKQASLHYILQLLVAQSHKDKITPEFVQQILLIHPLLCSSDEFAQRLIALYDVEDCKALLVPLLIQFSSMHNMLDDRDTSRTIMKFVVNLEAKTNPEEKTWAKQLKQSLIQATTSNPKLDVKNRRSVSIKAMKTNSDVTHMDVNLLSQHLTASAWRTFRSLQPQEFFNSAWMSEQKEKLSPNLLQLITDFNTISHWVSSQILIANSKKQRVATIEYFIKLMKLLRECQNFHTMCAVFGGLNMQCIQRLKETWKGVGKKQITQIQSISTHVDALHNWKQYRATISKCKPPLIPFEGVILSDILKIDQVIPLKEGNLFNMSKLSQLYEPLKLLQQSRMSIGYQYSENLAFAEMLASSVNLDEDQLFQLSWKVEPPR